MIRRCLGLVAVVCAIGPACGNGGGALTAGDGGEAGLDSRVGLDSKVGADGRADRDSKAGLDSRTGRDSEAGACRPGQRILVDESENARDLGGTPLPSGRAVACAALYRGAVLSSLSAQGCDEITRLGIRTVIDLRTESERLAEPETNCVLAQTHIVLAPMPIPYSVSPQDYLADLHATESVATAFAALGDAAAYPVYFHCLYGRDRTGVLAAVILLALGATRESVLAEYQLTAAAGLATYPTSLEAVLDAIDALGGIDAYLAAAGIPAAASAVLRDRSVAR